jgi:murein DD-endopeptidase MepM/ murein hydrolase activator NlpD
MRIEFEGSGADLVLATDYTPEQAPVPLPNRHSGIITVTVHKQNCNRNNSNPQAPLCGPKEVLSTREYPMTQRPHFHDCVTLYGHGSNRVFAVDDRSPDDFEVEYVAGFVLYTDNHYDPGTQPVYGAEGYYVGNDGQNPSSFPSVNNIGVFDHFALHNTDFYPVFEPTSSLERTALLESQGVDKASGLRWPRIRGQLNGHPYTYSCYVPPVVRDAVNLCPGVDYATASGGDHAFYRLPFAEGDTEWGQGQGNDGAFTHSGGFAYDMVAPLDQTILIARAGRVEDLKESATQQCDANDDSDDDTCPAGNYLYVRHQDGSVGQYVHMPHNGVTPQVGDIVLRGDEVGRVGVTGNTTGPHLHFAARRDVPGSGGTKLALFEAVDPDDEDELLRCYEPPDSSGSLVPLRSNNIPR